MPSIEFTANLQRHVNCPGETIAATSVADFLAQYFEHHPGVRSFILDDQGSVRRHVKILVDGLNLSDREQLSDTLGEHSRIHVFQALSGG